MYKRTEYYLMISLLLVSFLGGCGQVSPGTGDSKDLSNLRGILVDISTKNGKRSFGTDEDVLLHVTITNTNVKPIILLKWFTPLEGVERSLFTVLRDGLPVAYRGILVKRPAPTEKDYITLAGGESLVCDLNLSDSYDLSVPGEYTVTYNVSSPQLFAWEAGEGSIGTSSLVSNIVQLSINK
jgi:hypothetical protein